MRNIGIDTAYLKERDHNLLIDKALTEKRVIITKDKKFFEKKKDVPTYFLRDSNIDTGIYIHIYKLYIYIYQFRKLFLYNEFLIV